VRYSFRARLSAKTLSRQGEVMLLIKVTIERFTDEHNPGWVQCSFVDAAGISHMFEEKVPVVSSEDLDSKSLYPRPGGIGCIETSTRIAPDGRELVMVDTEMPWAIESKT
jgi:hypothetical protein